MTGAPESSVCLCMIVRNEARVIRRALESARAMVDYWVICDTGSEDETPAIVLESLSGLPGELHGSEWVSFGHNRTEALRLARPRADYTLLLDADMVVRAAAPFKGELTADWYDLRYEGAVDYSQPMLLSNAHAWEFVGATHEYVRSPTAVRGGALPQLSLVHFEDGGMRGDKFKRDIRLLEEASATDPDDERALFYLAQSHFDTGDFGAALECYRRRIEHGGGWDEELWFSRFRAAEARRLLGDEAEGVLAAHLDAYAARPERLEPLCALARSCRKRGEFALGHLFAAAGEGAPYPPDRLFIDRDAHTWALPLERGLCAYGLGRAGEAVRAFNEVLDAPEAPDWATDAAIGGTHGALDLLYGSPEPMGRRNRIKVVVAFHNPGHFLDDCVESLLAQDHGDFEVICVDDASDDGAVASLPLSDPRFTYLRSEDRLGGAGSIHRALTECCEPDDVVVHLDGDDRLACPDALSHIDDLYRRHDCWVTYGQFRWSSGELGLCRPFATAAEFGRLRESWVTSHTKTYRAGLYHRIGDQDPDFACMKDTQGRWLGAAVDAALMFPLLELAGFERTRFSDRVTYVYNADNPASVHRDRLEEQTSVFEELRRRRRFAPLRSLENRVEALL